MQKGLIQDEKKQLRRELHCAMNMAQKSAESKKLLHRLLLLPAFQATQNVLMYHPLPQEPNLLALLENSSHHFFFPRMQEDHLELYKWSPQVRWIVGPYGVEEPDPQTWRFSSITEIDLALIPGIAFDIQGHRLGRGAGYFDRLLGKSYCHAIKVGIAWSWQIVKKIPTEEHDVKMDFIATPEKIFHGE